MSGLRWLVVWSATRQVAFRALGAHARPEITRVLGELGDLPALRKRIRTAAGRHRFARVSEASADAHPDSWSELHALAEGAQVPTADLELLSVRGDLGDEAEGCSDYAWSDGTTALLGHNEDGDPALDGACFLLTLITQDHPSVTTFWYPGFLPGNTFSINDHGLVWAVDSIDVPQPANAPGRAYAAWGLQHASTIDDAVAYLKSHPAAGGISYSLGVVGQTRLVTVEHAAGHCIAVDMPTHSEAQWHTNHLRYLPDALNRASSNSIHRGAKLGRAARPEPANSVGTLDVLGAVSAPIGADDAGRSLTLCALVADLTSATLTLRRAAYPTVTAPIDAFMSGRADSTSYLDTPLGAKPPTRATDSDAERS